MQYAHAGAMLAHTLQSADESQHNKSEKSGILCIGHLPPLLLL